MSCQTRPTLPWSADSLSVAPTDTSAGGARRIGAVPASSDPGYKLGPNDRLRITVFGQPTLTGEYTLDGNGVLAFPLIGNVPASGMTTQQLQKTIAGKLEPDYLINPSVSAEVVTRRPFFIIGEVQKPGNYPYVPDMTALNAMAMATSSRRWSPCDSRPAGRSAMADRPSCSSAASPSLVGARHRASRSQEPARLVRPAGRRARPMPGTSW
jgi:hypothetical protein